MSVTKWSCDPMARRSTKDDSRIVLHESSPHVVRLPTSAMGCQPTGSAPASGHRNPSFDCEVAVLLFSSLDLGPQGHFASGISSAREVLSDHGV